MFRAQLDELEPVLSHIDSEEFSRTTALLATSSGIFLTGQGRNGLAMHAFANRLMQLRRPVAVLGDILTGPVRTGNLLVIGSSGGTTPALLARADAAHHHGAIVIAMTGDRESPLANRSDHVLLFPVDRANSAQPLGTLFEQCLIHTCDALVQALMECLHINAEAMRLAHANLE
jgi:6-phospho-3-hexuloisomerase